eukprot:CAMPEP_0119003948 /NCGR_PEP_ID=MMETSP1176-20130426/861_1 /TAXON_ID=265551 /ORGANISM="Synedropsis recta cf, Strain CCMP1620" /LENGTH=196 /DNA_ID=CAMNT_0006955599 /DNA_START=28 /DNA_END=618 /DNA_ORIENTATION=+
MTTTTSTSVRYKSLLTGIEKVLSKSRSSLDISQAIQQGYGEDASVFGGAGVLTGVMDAMLDRVHDKVTEEMLAYLQQQGIEQDLSKVEELVQTIEAIEKAQHAENEADRESAKASLQQTQLPEGVKPMDVVNHRAYQLMLEEQTKLTEMICKYEEETKELEEVVKEAEAKVQADMTQVEEVGRELDRAADVCATLS